MTTLGFVLLIITWIIVGMATKGRKHTSQNQWQREDKRKRSDEFAQKIVDITIYLLYFCKEC